MYFVDKVSQISKKLRLGPPKKGTLFSLKKVHTGAFSNSAPKAEENHSPNHTETCPNSAPTAALSEQSTFRTFQDWSKAENQKSVAKEEKIPVPKKVSKASRQAPKLVKIRLHNCGGKTRSHTQYRHRKQHTLSGKATATYAGLTKRHTRRKELARA